MEDYLWLWLSASSFINNRSSSFNLIKEKLFKEKKKNCYGIRWTNTTYFPKYIWDERIEKSTIQPLSEKDYLIESFFLSLRTDRWVEDILKYKSILVNDWEEKISAFIKSDFLRLHENRVVLTDKWMDCYNGIVTELLDEI